jgi:cysteinyl-tRNA synthetase
MIAVKESLQIRLSDREVRLKIHDEERVFERQEVAAIFLDHKQLVLLDMNGRELLREEADGKPKALAEAFIRAGYDWREQDPFAHEYARWVADAPGLSPGANALFLAREKAIGRDDKEDAEDLRQELSKLGVTVRDEKKRQYWRMHGRRP